MNLLPFLVLGRGPCYAAAILEKGVSMVGSGISGFDPFGILPQFLARTSIGQSIVWSPPSLGGRPEVLCGFC